LMAKY